MQPRRRQSPKQDLRTQLLLREIQELILGKRLVRLRISRSQVRLLHRNDINGHLIPVLGHIRIGIVLHRLLVGHIIRSTNTDSIRSEELERIGHVIVRVCPAARPEIDVLHDVGAIEDAGGVGRIVEGSFEVFLACVARSVVGLNFNRCFGEVEAVYLVVERDGEGFQEALESFADVRVPLRGCPAAGDEVVVAVITVALLYTAVIVDGLAEVVRDWVIGAAEGAVLDLDPEVLSLGPGAVEIVGDSGEVVLVTLGLQGFPCVQALDTLDLGTLQESESFVINVAGVEPLGN